MVVFGDDKNNGEVEESGNNQNKFIEIWPDFYG